MITNEQLAELIRLLNGLQEDTLGELRINLIYGNLDKATGETSILHDDGDYAAYVMGNMGLGIDSELFAQYIISACNLAPELVAEIERLRAKLAVANADAERLATALEWLCGKMGIDENQALQMHQERVK